MRKKIILVAVIALLVILAILAYFFLPKIFGGTDYSLHYPEEVIKCAARFGNAAQPALVEAVIDKESGGVLDSRSPVSSLGLMQLQFKTAQSHQNNPELDGLGPRPITRQALLSDAETNICFGVSVLAGYLDVFKGDVKAALAAYNAGKAAGQRVVKGRKNGYAEDTFARFQVYSEKYGLYLERR